MLASHRACLWAIIADFRINYSGQKFISPWRKQFFPLSMIQSSFLGATKKIFVKLFRLDWFDFCPAVTVTRKKLPKVYKSCPKMISIEKLKILTPLQKLPKNVGDLGKLIVAKSI